MSSRLRILCDLDGCIFDTLPLWLQEYRKLTDDDVYPRHVKTYGFAQYVAKPDVFFKTLEIGDVFLKAPLMPNAKQAVDWLYAKHDLYFVTYSHEAVRNGHRQKLDAMRHWFPQIPEDRVIFTKHKHLVHGDILVEDCVQNAVKWNEAHPGNDVYIIEHPYNIAEANVNSVPLIKSLLEVVEDVG